MLGRIKSKIQQRFDICFEVMATATLMQKFYGEGAGDITDASTTSPGVCSSLRNSQELGLQLRFAAEKGRMLEVRKLLAAGAPVLRDAVSFFPVKFSSLNCSKHPHSIPCSLKV